MPIERKDSLCRQKKYRSNVKFIIDCNIVEYDITAANVSILTDRGIISNSDRELLMELPKLDREIAIGMQLRDNKINYDEIATGIADAKCELMRLNNFSDEDIFLIDNDALYIINKPLAKNLQVGKYTSFRVDNIWSSYCRLSNSIELFYFYNRYQNVEKFRAKGLGASASLHQNFFISFLKELFFTAQNSGIKDAIEFLQNFYKAYIDKTLDIGFYREFTSAGRYAANISSITNSKYYMDTVYPFQVNDLDISYNAAVLREIMGYLYNEIFKRTKY